MLALQSPMNTAFQIFNTIVNICVAYQSYLSDKRSDFFFISAAI